MTLLSGPFRESADCREKQMFFFCSTFNHATRSFCTHFFLVLFTLSYKSEASWIWIFASLPRLGKFSAIVSLNNLREFFPFSSSGAPLMCKFFHLKIFHKSHRFSSLCFIPFLCSSDWFILNNLFSSSQIHSASYSSLDSIEANFLFHSLNPLVPEFSFYYFYLLNFSFCSCIVLLILLSHILYFLVAHWVSLKQLFWISCLTYYRSPLLESQLPKNYCFPLVVSGFCDFLCVFLEVLHCCLYT